MPGHAEQQQRPVGRQRGDRDLDQAPRADVLRRDHRAVGQRAAHQIGDHRPRRQPPARRARPVVGGRQRGQLRRRTPAPRAAAAARTAGRGEPFTSCRSGSSRGSQRRGQPGPLRVLADEPDPAHAEGRRRARPIHPGVAAARVAERGPVLRADEAVLVDQDGQQAIVDRAGQSRAEASASSCWAAGRRRLRSSGGATGPGGPDSCRAAHRRVRRPDAGRPGRARVRRSAVGSAADRPTRSARRRDRTAIGAQQRHVTKSSQLALSGSPGPPSSGRAHRLRPPARRSPR